MPYAPSLDLKEIERKVRELARETAGFIRQEARSLRQEDVEAKGLHDYVTRVDKASEKKLVEGLMEILPQAGFITEEGTESQEGERYNWIVDPLDGTTNYIHGIPFCCISIALQDKRANESPSGQAALAEGEIILGVIHQIDTGEQFHAIWGERAKADDRPIAVSKRENLEDSLILTGFPYTDFNRIEGYMALLQETMKETAGVRRMGSAALDLALVASGKSEIFYEYGLKPWDVAAGQFIIKQAGGQVCDFSGGNRYLHGQEIVCGPSRLLEKFLKKVRHHLSGIFLPLAFMASLFLGTGFSALPTQAAPSNAPSLPSGSPVSAKAAAPAEAPESRSGSQPGPAPQRSADSNLASPAPAAASATAQETLYRFQLDEDIGPAALRIVEKALKEAREMQADYILMELNTFGGALKEADRIRTLLLECPIPTLVYIDINAASAGALISIACDSIYMNPAATIGSATVVDAQGEVQPDKYQSYMRAIMRATAQATGRDPEIAEAMVDARPALPGTGQTGSVLAFTAQEALQHHYCQGIFPDAEAVIQALGIEEDRQASQQLGALDRIIHFLVNPFVSGILILLIVGGIYFELQTPGIGFALAVSIAACLLYFAPHYIEGLAAHWEILLFLLGMILIVLEIFVIPGFGIAGASGILLACTALVLALVDNWGMDFSHIHPLKLLEAFAVVVVSAIAALFAGFHLSRRIFGKPVFGHALALDSTQKKDEGFVAVSQLSSYQSLIGETARTISMLRPSGKIRIKDSVFDAQAETGFIEKDLPVRIIRFENAQFIVRKL